MDLVTGDQAVVDDMIIDTTTEATSERNSGGGTCTGWVCGTYAGRRGVDRITIDVTSFICSIF